MYILLDEYINKIHEYFIFIWLYVFMFVSFSNRFNAIYPIPFYHSDF